MKQQMDLNKAISKVAESRDVMQRGLRMIELVKYIGEVAERLPEQFRIEFLSRVGLLIIALKNNAYCWCDVEEGKLERWLLIKEAFAGLETSLHRPGDILEEESPDENEADGWYRPGLNACINLQLLVLSLAKAVAPSELLEFEWRVIAKPNPDEEQSVEAALDLLSISVSTLRHGIELTRIIDQIEMHGRSLPQALRHDFFRRSGLILVAMRKIPRCWCAYHLEDQTEKKAAWSLIELAFEGLPTFIRNESGFLARYRYITCTRTGYLIEFLQVAISTVT